VITNSFAVSRIPKDTFVHYDGKNFSLISLIPPA
jgi:hypothetical protein